MTVYGLPIPIVQTNAFAPMLSNFQNVEAGATQFSFINIPNAGFTVLATTNVSLPVADWTVIGNATNISSGLYQFTDPGRQIRFNSTG